MMEEKEEIVHLVREHQGEVDKESGHIQFAGDVMVDGNVQPSMYVGGRRIQINGMVTKASVHALQSAVIEDNIFSSTIIVGRHEVTQTSVLNQLSELVVYLKQIQQELAGHTDELTINPIMRTVIENKFPSFQELNKSFVQQVKNHSSELGDDWSAIAHKYYQAFTSVLYQEIRNRGDIQRLIEQGEMLVRQYVEKPAFHTSLAIPYAINSILHCTGDISVTAQGLYRCSVVSGSNVFVEGVCRGGDITAKQKISIHETGSKSGVKTIVKTESYGSITIGLAYPGTEIHIGTKRHTFIHPKLGVFARLLKDGTLQID